MLCGGAFNSPQLLQLSGVGDAEHLRSLGIEPVPDLPAVGQHLQDHLEVYIQHACTQPVSMQPWLKMWKRPYVGLLWLFRKGPGATNHFEGGGFVRSNDEVAYPNLMFHFLPIAIRYDGSAPAGGHGYQVHIGPMYSDARGSVRSNPPTPRPSRRSGSTTSRQSRTGASGSRRSASLAASSGSRRSASSTAASSHPVPRSRPTSRSSNGSRSDAETALHPSCTCRMGDADDDSVVDPLTMGVHGLQGVRVVDASAMRYVTNGNIYAPVMMMAEKAADLILGNTPLPPEHVDLYRHTKEASG